MLDHLVWFILIVVVAVFSLTVPNYFQIGIFANIVEQSTFVATLAIGLSLLIIAGYMDLSVESVMALAAMVIGILFAKSGVGLGITLHARLARRADLARDRTRASVSVVGATRTPSSSSA